MAHPCLTCGACCAHYRVSMHWSEAAPELGGNVPMALTEPVSPHQVCMRGTWQPQPRCVALDADIGVRSRCTIHPQRPSACRAVAASWEFGEVSPQCDRARMAHGLAPLTAFDWRWREAAINDAPCEDDPNDHPGGGLPPALPPPIAA